MPMIERAPQASVRPQLARWSDVAIRTVRKHWVLSLAIGAMLLAALGSLDVGRKVESWTASATIALGTMPSLDGLLGRSAMAVERVESARELVTRIGGIQFQDSVLADARKALHDRRGAFAGASLRGIVIDDSIIRLEASSASKEEALILLQQAVAAIQAVHQKLLEPRMELLRSVRDSLQDAKVRLSDSLKKGDIYVTPARPDGTALMSSPGGSVDGILNVETRIALLTYSERTVRMTGLQDGSPPVMEGPREVNLVQRAILAGLGIVLFIGLLTFLLKRSVRVG
ncbi:hypothetical protein EOW77_0032920 [Bradyrhizobium yuanmingense]|uniref:hypothetical protein n=1 Tax=Bradyrhizobium yuanmingense TaxID=108015 RepID=UPI000FE43C4D|nr:hypothetical protein [Bradyrhizobium yuanmingense]TGN75191.1 hypothetical protein EOW77_0032920 [Bradyrhizobium yuanmingense]